MLLKVHDGENGRELKNMLIGKCSEMALFTQDLQNDSETVTAIFNPPDGAEKQQIEILLKPDCADLEELDIDLHRSPTKAYDMGSRYNDWFSSCFGYGVVLAYIGSNQRPVLGNLAPNSQSKSWTSSLTSKIFGGSTNGLTFADIANYLIITEESVDDVSGRLPDGVEMDITKFRPNIVVQGSPAAWDEDFWGAISINGAELQITASCHRCQSIDVDYTTGKYSSDEKGRVLKTLMKDRRVDKGAKWSPVFGRYGFSTSGSFEISVGDEVTVTKRNSEHTVIRKFKFLDVYFSLTQQKEWPGIGTNKS